MVGTLQLIHSGPKQKAGFVRHDDPMAQQSRWLEILGSLTLPQCQGKLWDSDLFKELPPTEALKQHFQLASATFASLSVHLHKCDRGRELDGHPLQNERVGCLARLLQKLRQTKLGVSQAPVQKTEACLAGF